MPAFLFIGGKNPGSQIITATGAGTFVVPYYAENLRVRGWGAGGGGQGTPNNAAGVTNGTDGGATTFSPPPGVLTAGGGTRAFLQGGGFNFGNPGTASGGDINTTGQSGGIADFQATNIGRGGAAANTAQGGGAYAQVPQTNVRKNGTPGNTYGGGGSGATGLTGSGYFTVGGGGGGAFVEKVYLPGELSAGSSISYIIGAGGAGGVNTWTGGAGANGALVIEWDY